VDWGPHADRHQLRLTVMSKVVDIDTGPLGTVPISILDVGCGYGAQLDYLEASLCRVNYTGVDLCEEMVVSARNRHTDAEFVVGDILGTTPELVGRKFDYVLCNGILTQTLGVSRERATKFTMAVIQRCFDLSERGIAVNMMSTHVNYRVPNLNYQNPETIRNWIRTHLTTKIALIEAYGLFEFTVFAYR
jgi:SAM-dependent methyltransferase